MSSARVAAALCFSLVACDALEEPFRPDGGADASVGDGAVDCRENCGAFLLEDDFDGDRVLDDRDNCPFVPNPTQGDDDGDGVGDECDNAPAVSNPNQADRDEDGAGDVADDDDDGDGATDANDSCPLVPNPLQTDLDSDGVGDACDDDDDGDGTLDAVDPCPKLAGVSDPAAPGCTGDADLDTVPDGVDNCPTVANPAQDDLDGDETGDVCDPDRDGDGVFNALDNAPDTPNADQIDLDRDGLGDVDDGEYCFVIPPYAPTMCLNPLEAFAVRGRVESGPADGARVGDRVELGMVSNRSDLAPQGYAWTLRQQPEGSMASIENASGSAMTVAELIGAPGIDVVRFLVEPPPEITFDVAGTYVFEVEVMLAEPDPVFPGGPMSSTHSFQIDAARNDRGCVCP